MRSFGKSQAVRRTEDLRFLRGAGRYVDDIAPEGALHAAFVRSPVAHAELRGLDVADAAAMEGVACVLTAEDLGDLDATVAFYVLENADGSKAAAPARPLLATGRMRFVGEPVALVVAATAQAARDAAEAVAIDYEELPVNLAVAPGGPAIHEEAPGNVCFDWETGDRGGTQEAFDRAARTVRARIEDNRVIAASLEPRGAYAEWGEDGRVHLCFNGQGVWGMKRELARVFGIEADRVRVTNPDVGGGFGMKASAYPEYFLIAEAARRVGAPVRWMADRSEAMLADNGGRDLVSEAEMAFDAEDRLIGYRVDTVCNLGAYVSEYGQGVQTECFAKVLTAAYDVPAAHLRCRGVFTNTCQVDSYRGAGRPEAIYVIERMMDLAARELGVDPWELRRRNFVTAFPYRSATGELYDVGDFARVMDRVAAEADAAGLAGRRAEAKRRGRLLGQGLCYYIESILGNPSEGARVVFGEDGRVELHVGTQSNGQGHETVYARFLADHTGIPMDLIDVVQGDSDVIPRGGGTGGSRSVTTQGTATLATAEAVRNGFAAFLAEREGVPPADVSFDDERFRVAGSNVAPTMMETAEMAREAGRADLLDRAERTKLPGRSYPNGAHLTEVEVDPETGLVEVVRYVVADDFGNLINPMLAEGQVHGGVAQGIGQAVTEHVVYDDQGQLLTASFMDYGMPRAHDVPMIAFHSEPVPSTANVLGMKGCGEAGTVGALAAVANAVAGRRGAAGHPRRADAVHPDAHVAGHAGRAGGARGRGVARPPARGAAGPAERAPAAPASGRVRERGRPSPRYRARGRCAAAGRRR